MKKLFYILIFVIVQTEAQTIDLSSINSKNILDYFEKNNTTGSKENVNSITSVYQYGNSNNAEIINKSGKGFIQMSQVGNFNTSYFNNPYKEQRPETSFNVKGSNNHIDITGTNSISEKMIINLSTNDKMIFIRNY